jgi:1-phosphofructokinase family hexose kinase
MILCLGTTPALQRTMQFDALTLGEVNRATHVRVGASGKSINVARVLHTLGYPVLATGFLGGSSGELIRRDLDQSSIPHEFIDVSATSRTCTTVIDRGRSSATELIDEPQPIDPENGKHLESLVKSRLPRAAALVLSGTIAPGITPDFYARCVRMAKEHAVPTIVDATGEALRLALGEHPGAIKPNRSELAATLGRPIDNDADLQTAARELSKRADWVFITLGAEGAVACDRDHLLRATPPPVDAISPIGSGDSFTAAIAAALTTKMTLADALRLAIAAGTANTLTPDPGRLLAADVSRLEPLVQLR